MSSNSYLSSTITLPSFVSPDLTKSEVAMEVIMFPRKAEKLTQKLTIILNFFLCLYVPFNDMIKSGKKVHPEHR